ncbi:hypothetical protein BKA65DRAFT_411449, partial [Rhexocercosporidium sp. MPI-PUGE-AT-0058]
TPFNIKFNINYYTFYSVTFNKIVLEILIYGRLFIKTKSLKQSFKAVETSI